MVKIQRLRQAVLKLLRNFYLFCLTFFNYNIKTIYGHISSWTVKTGETVKAGQIIAISGNEGTSSGPHLHLTIREGAYKGKAEDPKKYININY